MAPPTLTSEMKTHVHFLVTQGQGVKKIKKEFLLAYGIDVPNATLKRAIARVKELGEQVGKLAAPWQRQFG